MEGKFGTMCDDCKREYIDFSSEGQTWDYSEDADGNMLYTCESCLNKLQEEAQCQPK